MTIVIFKAIRFPCLGAWSGKANKLLTRTVIFKRMVCTLQSSKIKVRDLHYFLRLIAEDAASATNFCVSLLARRVSTTIDDYVVAVVVSKNSGVNNICFGATILLMGSFFPTYILYL